MSKQKQRPFRFLGDILISLQFLIMHREQSCIPVHNCLVSKRLKILPLTQGNKSKKLINQNNLAEHIN